MQTNCSKEGVLIPNVGVFIRYFTTLGGIIVSPDGILSFELFMGIYRLSYVYYSYFYVVI